MSDLAYIYLIQDGNDKGTNIFKIGRTVQKGSDSRKIKRIQGYSKGTVTYNLWKVDDHMLNEIENHIKISFKDKYVLSRGTEWFEGDVVQMKKDIDILIDEIIKKYKSGVRAKDEDEDDSDSECYECLACNGTGISYWSDGIYGNCLEYR